MRNFNSEMFLEDLQTIFEIEENNLLQNDPNNNFESFISSFLVVLNKHAPLKLLPRREKKLFLKPWITKRIYNSIKTKNRLFRICYKHGDITKIAFYKTYCNKVTHLKRTSKIQYYNKLFNECNNNNSETWKLINTLITKKEKSTHKIIRDKISINE